MVSSIERREFDVVSPTGESSKMSDSKLSPCDVAELSMSSVSDVVCPF